MWCRGSPVRAGPVGSRTLNTRQRLRGTAGESTVQAVDSVAGLAAQLQAVGPAVVGGYESSRLQSREALFVGRGKAQVASNALSAGGAAAKPPRQEFGGHEPDPALASSAASVLHAPLWLGAIRLGYVPMLRGAAIEFVSEPVEHPRQGLWN